MARYIFDLETDGLLAEVSKVHSLVMIDVDTGEMLSFAEHPDYPDIRKGLIILSDADEVIGHNIISFDLPVLKKLFNWTVPDCTSMKVTDTLVLARLVYPDVAEWDARLVAKGKMPGNLIGRQSLESWGHRLGNHKGDYKGGWEKWSPEMQTYCEQDTRLTLQLYNHLVAKVPSQRAVDLEHKVAAICYQIETNGFPFDDKKAVHLWGTLTQRHDVLKEELKTLFPPWQSLKKVKGQTEFIAKVNNKKLGRVKGEKYTIPITIEFNPASRDHIANRLADKYGWKPKVFTGSGKAQIDETVLAGLPYPEAKQLAEMFLVEKRISQLATGNEAWLKKQAKDGRIHARYNSNGAVTGRATHMGPNIAQVPKVGKPYGAECRELFKASPGYVVVGADLQGLELRCLGHYMTRWDNGSYADIVVNGDPHTENMNAMQLEEYFEDKKVRRDKAKTIVYAVLYGAGDPKVGSIVGKKAQTGKVIRERLKKNLNGFGKLVDAVAATVTMRGFLTGLDGRKLKIRSKHAALNTLLQSCGAILCKAWLVKVEEYLREAGYRHGVGQDYAFLAWVHDEIQIEVKEGLEHDVGNIIFRAANDAGKELNFVPPLDAEYKVGANWKETH